MVLIIYPSFLKSFIDIAKPINRNCCGGRQRKDILSMNQMYPLWIYFHFITAENLRVLECPPKHNFP